MRGYILYEIVNLINLKRYIGVTSTKLRERWSVHLYRLRNGRSTPKLQEDFDKYGESAFAISQIATGDKDRIFSIEKAMTKETSVSGYNAIVGGGGKEERQRAAQIWLDKLKNDDVARVEVGRRLALHRPKIRSAEARGKQSKARRGKAWTERQRASRQGTFVGSKNPNYGNFSQYLQLSTGVFYTKAEMLSYIGIAPGSLQRLIKNKDKRILNFVKV